MVRKMGREWVVAFTVLAGIALEPSSARGGIEEHNPLPTSEELEILVLDDGFWDSVDEERRSASQSDPTTDLSSDGIIGNSSWVEHSNDVGLDESWQLENESSFAGQLGGLSPEQEDFARLKWKLATVGLDLLTEEELENLQVELEETGVIEPEDSPNLDGNIDASNSGGGGTAQAETAATESDESDGEDETGAKSGALLGEHESSVSDEGGCKQTRSSGATGIGVWGLLLAGLLAVQRKFAIDAH